MANNQEAIQEVKSNFHHQGKTNSTPYDQDKALKAKSTKELDDLIQKYDTHPGTGMMKTYIEKAKAERARRVGVKKESSDQFTFLADLLNEADTAGLKLGALKLDTQDNCIYVTIGGHKYKYTPNVADKAGEVYASVTGMAKHSTGRALAFLKKNATGEKLNEATESRNDPAAKMLYEIDKILKDKLNRMGYSMNLDPDSLTATFSCSDNDEPSCVVIDKSVNAGGESGKAVEVSINNEKPKEFNNSTNAARYIAGIIS